MASEKNLPTNFNEIALERKEVPHFQYLVSRVYDQAQFKEAWNYFGFNEQIPKVHFEEKVLLFIGLYESGSCPYELENINTTIESKEMTIFLSETGGDCTADATPRSFVIELDKESSNHIKNVVIVQSGVETTVPIIDRK
ncbi:hypothetical protein [Psychrobacillus vulpis]|uniref:Uncharacterized protein n=1 Tax=Psychrobacillus vulpis TaxID=2325572 RepID=A0A544TPP0_9BACI|nr:hypothetical protein [Psychrobacillus vulpis]TQR19418.1 hypothetical protein FG384_12260 [Psychrobacillus vulpis]